MTLATHPARAFMPYPQVAVPHAASGPLQGLSFAVKDLFDVAGYPTGGGNPHVLARSGIKAATAPAVQRLLDAGAAFVGKTHTDELAFSMNGQNAHYGRPVNGAAPDRITGGSSSGSASAVSNGLCDFALGSDTGGSVRAPASHCGLFGIRPTHGRISLERCLPLSESLDTCGFFASDIGTFARVAEVLFGADPAPLPAAPRLLVATDLFGQPTPEARGALAPAVARIEAALGRAAPVTVADRPLSELWWAFRYVQGWEAWHSDGELIEQHGLELGADVAARFAFSKAVTRSQFDEASAVRRDFTAHVGRLLGQDGVLVLPTMPDIAPLRAEPVESLETYRNLASQTLCLTPLSGFPQLNLPLARRDGAPLGISLLGPAGSDRSLVALAERIMAHQA
ncbi:glutamyl-tRNA(Gln) amidotransferase subunit A [Cupriavidus necator N-1]|jgi:amidase|uniref:Glutamyl-tRNA(Gln) amidotransferase subunit A n=1 Tax=Cupriavidus necator (strain ATCC 43291 / DSM 13513 / CCUG 52238 / LMG 8453 / N-1) TaxID=1042878 RepID=G0ETM5_CUPNN|nr:MULTISPECIES: amidase [Cupriavidus]AEI76851.1 glutamyl-tRNA(Gln) amidotransferase subunit A [Cupriavidus necator N-1]KAI3602491.1 Amidase [Cupriavidus necator H850]MDX6014579.1 amidase [Cupriavidus necator]QUN29784.1 amidase [Cupriavidus sp. KK10]